MPVGLSPGIPKVIISNSGAVSATGATPNFKNSTVYGGGIGACEAVTLYLDVTANTGTGGANQAWIEYQVSPDNGTTWFTAERFSQVTSSTATMYMSFRTNGLGANEAAVNAGAIQTNTAAVINNMVFPLDQRVKWTIATGQSLTFGLYAFIQPVGTRYN